MSGQKPVNMNAANLAPVMTPQQTGQSMTTGFGLDVQKAAMSPGHSAAPNQAQHMDPRQFVAQQQSMNAMPSTQQIGYDLEERNFRQMQEIPELYEQRHSTQQALRPSSQQMATDAMGVGEGFRFLQGLPPLGEGLAYLYNRSIRNGGAVTSHGELKFDHTGVTVVPSHIAHAIVTSMPKDFTALPYGADGQVQAYDPPSFAGDLSPSPAPVDPRRLPTDLAPQQTVQAASSLDMAPPPVAEPQGKVIGVARARVNAMTDEELEQLFTQREEMIKSIARMDAENAEARAASRQIITDMENGAKIPAIPSNFTDDERALVENHIQMVRQVIGDIQKQKERESAVAKATEGGIVLDVETKKEEDDSAPAKKAAAPQKKATSRAKKKPAPKKKPTSRAKK